MTAFLEAAAQNLRIGIESMSAYGRLLPFVRREIDECRTAAFEQEAEVARESKN